LKLIDFVYHSTLDLRVIKKKKKKNLEHIGQSRPDSGLDLNHFQREGVHLRILVYLVIHDSG